MAKKKTQVYIGDADLENRIDEILCGVGPVTPKIAAIIRRAEREGAEKMRQYCIKHAENKYRDITWSGMLRVAAVAIAQDFRNIDIETE